MGCLLSSPRVGIMEPRYILQLAFLPDSHIFIPRQNSTPSPLPPRPLMFSNNLSPRRTSSGWPIYSKSWIFTLNPTVQPLCRGDTAACSCVWRLHQSIGRCSAVAAKGTSDVDRRLRGGKEYTDVSRTRGSGVTHLDRFYPLPFVGKSTKKALYRLLHDCLLSTTFSLKMKRFRPWLLYPF